MLSDDPRKEKSAAHWTPQARKKHNYSKWTASLPAQGHYCLTGSITSQCAWRRILGKPCYERLILRSLKAHILTDFLFFLVAFRTCPWQVVLQAASSIWLRLWGEDELQATCICNLGIYIFGNTYLTYFPHPTREIALEVTTAVIIHIWGNKNTFMSTSGKTLMPLHGLFLTTTDFCGRNILKLKWKVDTVN